MANITVSGDSVAECMRALGVRHYEIGINVCRDDYGRGPGKLWLVSFNGEVRKFNHFHEAMTFVTEAANHE